jgi:tetratricopeptide (TPR) repeat protein
LTTAVVCALLAYAAFAQQTPKASLDTSETLFTVMAAMNACGYDQELSASDPLRSQVRAEVAQAVAASPEAAEAQRQVCAFYRDHQQPDPSRDLAQYVSLSLYLGEPPQFAITTKEADLPPDAAYILGLVGPLRTFYDAAGLHKVWTNHIASYDALIERFHDPIARVLTQTDYYLRLPISGYLGRKFVIYFEPQGAPGQVNARNYGADYFLVLSPTGSNLRLDQVRHTYLHYILDPLLLKRANSMRRLQPLLATVRSSSIDDSYKGDIALLVTESLIRAVEARMIGTGKASEPAREIAANAAVSEGFVLTRYFFDALQRFESEPTGFKDALGDILFGIDVDRERKRAADVQFTRQASPEVLKSASKRKEPGLLDLAEERLSGSDPDGAQKLARQALEEKKDDPARAMFILARAATLNKDIEGARTYFERTLEMAREPRLVAWSHIYLARIFDLQENREGALVHYRAALAAGDTTPDTRTAAERGLQQPYAPRSAADPK